MAMPSKKGLSIIVIAFFLLLFGCSDSKNIQELKAYLAKLKQMAHAKQKNVVLPPVQLPVRTIYQANVLRPPFTGQGAFMGENKDITNPLQAFSLNMLRFIGTLTENNITKAYILAPDNKIYQVKVGDILGDREGKVVNIYQDRLEVKEESTNDDALMSQRIITLQLKEQR